MVKPSLYITFDGLSDPLGQSQILPYLLGLAARGYRLTVLSCEKKARLEQEKESILQAFGPHQIEWQYILYEEDGNFLSRYRYIQKLRSLAMQQHQEKSFLLCHCRSYLAALVGLHLKKRYRVPFLFDMRGLWADERIDGGIWRKSNPLHRLFYYYFRKKEKEFLLQSDAVISLTQAALQLLSARHPGLEKKCTVIPCCVNTLLFNPAAVKKTSVPGIYETDHVIIYTGSVGTWYYTRELIECMRVWRELIPNLKLLIVSRDLGALSEVLKQLFEVKPDWIVYTSASYSQIPAMLSLAKASAFFIKPAFSKIASSPTKMAECWAMNLPIITNSGIGDNDIYFKDERGGILLNAFTKEEYRRAGLRYRELIEREGDYRSIALQDFDTALAVTRYSGVYQSLCGDRD